MPEYTEGLAGLIFPDGTYDFVCVDAVERESAQNNAMIELQLDVFNADLTNKVRVVDRLVFTPNAFWKIDSFRMATGEKINTGTKVCFEAEDCIDRRGRLHLKITNFNGKSRNEVDSYVEPDEQTQAPAAASSKQTTVSAPTPRTATSKRAALTPDDIPF
jgi:hypothetical protein